MVVSKIQKNLPIILCRKQKQNPRLIRSSKFRSNRIQMLMLRNDGKFFHIQKMQIGVCKRMTKEVASYEKEALHNEARIQKMRDENKDEYGLDFSLLFTGFSFN